jgi:hypothetical protein
VLIEAVRVCIKFMRDAVRLRTSRECACRGCESHCRGVRVVEEAVRMIIDILKVFF